MSQSPSDDPVDPDTRRVINRTLEQFQISPEKLQQGVRYFLQQMKDGLKNDSSSHSYMPMIPSFITHIPNGAETGLSLAGDLGGTNFRICSVELNGDHSFNLEQYKTKVDKTLMIGTAQELFAFLSKQIRYFLAQHHADYLKSDKAEKIKMSFTFSFPLNQTALNRGTLIRWTKGFNIPDAVDKDIVELFQAEIDALHLPVKIVAITNDTVGTLLANAYSTLTTHKTVLGCIFGTGTNGAYAEKLENITKLDPKVVEFFKSKNIDDMIINTEWGSFDNELKYLPTTIYDEIVDSETTNPGVHVFEKRISGMFLGELVRLVILDLHKRKLILQNYEQIEATVIKSVASSSSLVNLPNLPRRTNTTRLSHRILGEWNLNTETLSKIQIDDTKGLKVTDLVLQEALHINTTLSDRTIIKEVAEAVTTRAALLSSIAIAAVVLKTGRLGITLDDEGNLQKTHLHDEQVEVGADGAVIEFYPGFRDHIYRGLALSQLGEEFAKKVDITIAKDGSGVGAALCTNSHVE